MVKWVNGELLPFTCEDINDMQNSARWFARKFNSNNQDIMKHIIITQQDMK